ncbi:hypothetical protein GCM10022403_037140 [Streptomyces coacervatus]|uniref:Uncharacterized protein n=1 Tax=Streptomyces coacervatus TaxID=647381 RepID=A0ABP7HQH1_9ACTN|nr:hypothetical protein [Streptomyces coacervatus]MDF2270866.1 hypothetical protein [Streptomyces coacervatus]
MGAEAGTVAAGFPEEEFPYVGDNSRNSRIAVERPEAGRPALLHLVKRGEGEFVLSGQERGAGATRDAPPHMYSTDDCDARLLLPVNTTHLKVEPYEGEPCSWAMRVLPLGDAAVFTGEHVGESSDVLYRFDAEPGLFEIEVERAEDHQNWEVSFVCDHQLGGPLYVDSLCWECKAVTDREAERIGTRLADYVEATGEDGGRFFLPGSGVITFVSEDNCRWSLRTARL